MYAESISYFIFMLFLVELVIVLISPFRSAVYIPRYTPRKHSANLENMANICLTIVKIT